MERFSVLLGHSAIKVTEKYYAPWVRARQEQLEADVRRTWSPPEHMARQLLTSKSGSRQNLKIHVAVQGAAESHHLHWSRSGADWNRGFYYGGHFDRKDRRSAVEGDARGPCQIVSQH